MSSSVSMKVLMNRGVMLNWLANLASGSSMTALVNMCIMPPMGRLNANSSVVSKTVPTLG